MKVTCRVFARPVYCSIRLLLVVDRLCSLDACFFISSSSPAALSDRFQISGKVSKQ